MDPYLHTLIALGCIYVAYKVGAYFRKKEDIELFVQHLEEQGFVHIEQMKDGSYEFIKHWKFRANEQEDNA
jgi:hypothetical protein